MAASIQVLTEEVVLKLAKSLREDTEIKNLSLTGGVALNCGAMANCLKKIVDNIWIQPANGDAGSAWELR